MRSVLKFVFTLSLVCGYSNSQLQSQAELTKNWIANLKKLSVEKGVNTYNTPNANQIKYYVYTRSNAQAPQLIEPNVDSIAKSLYNPLKPTTISIHGWGGTLYNEENRNTVATKLAKEDCNVIVVDYNRVPQAEYHVAVANAPFIGGEVGRLIELLHKIFNAKLSQIHIVGYSLGAQIAGFAGKNVKKSLNQKVQRITGLDPAGPIFIDYKTDDKHLTKDDAHFVDVIHTNAGGWGFLLPCGHADYYPNGGSVQPGCNPNDINCSHWRAPPLVPEMWSSQNKFFSAKCANMEELNAKKCRYLNNNKMGENDSEHGLFYLDTNSAYPYGKGKPTL